MFIWAAAEAIGEVFSLRTSAAIAYPLGWTVALFSLTGLNTTLRFFDFATGPWVIFSAATAILVTGLSLLIAAVDRRRETPPG